MARFTLSPFWDDEPSAKRWLCCEVENRGESYHLNGNGTTTILGDLIARAIDVDGQPAFITAHIAPDTKTFCELAGIACHELGRQILPSSSRADVKKPLIPGRGDHGYEVVNPKRPIRRERMSKPIMRDVLTMGRSEWIRRAHERWTENFPIAKAYAERLRAGDRAAFAEYHKALRER